MEGRKKGDKLDRVFKSEKEIFDFLKMKYKNPEERNDPSINEIESDSTENTVSEPKNIVKVKRTTKEKRKICELVNNNNIDSLILKFKSEGIQILKDSSESQLSDMIKVANNAFHCKAHQLCLIMNTTYSPNTSQKNSQKIMLLMKLEQV